MIYESPLIFLSANDIKKFHANTIESPQPNFPYDVRSDGTFKLANCWTRKIGRSDSIESWIKGLNLDPEDKLIVYRPNTSWLNYSDDTSVFYAARYAVIRKEKPTIETLINLIETGKEKDKLIESAKEFFEPLKKLYVTKRYFYPSNSLSDISWTLKQEAAEEPLNIEYKYSSDYKIIVFIKFNIGKTTIDMSGIISNALSQTDFDFPLESESLKNLARLIKENGKDHKVKEETKALSEAAKHIVKEDIKSIIYSYFLQANDEITHNKIRSAISKKSN